jgi:hypothetical protein
MELTVLAVPDPPDQWHGPFRRPGSGLGVQRISLNFAAFRRRWSWASG